MHLVLRERSVVFLALGALALKMLIAPWATGDFSIGIMKNVSYLCDGLIMLSVLAYIPFTHSKFSFIYGVFFTLAITYSVSTILYTDKSFGSAINSHLRVFLPMLYAAMLSSFFTKRLDLAVVICKFVVIYTAFLLVIGLLILPVSYNRGAQVFWPTYFGGLHTTAYVAIATFFLCYVLHVQGSIRKWALVLIGIAVFGAIFFGWGVRTTSLSMLIFVGILFVRSQRIFGIPLSYLVVPVFIVSLVYVLVLFLGSSEFDFLTSGRLSMYGEKMIQLSRNSAATWIIGNGYGSDLIITAIWWWEAKGSHSDILTFLVEGGLLYLGLTLFIIIKLYRYIAISEAKFLFISYLFTSLISNGYFTRTLPSYLFFFSIALIYAYIQNEKLQAKQ